MPTRILIVEDEYLVAMDLQKTLEDAGFDVLGPVPSVARALLFLGEVAPDGCILDINLRGEYSTPVAAELKRREIPFVLSSAQLSDQLAPLDAFRGSRISASPPATSIFLLRCGKCWIDRHRAREPALSMMWS